MKMYAADQDTVREVEVEWATDHHVRVAGTDGRDGYYRPRLSDNTGYFPTWEEARSYLLHETERKWKIADRRANDLWITVQRLSNLKPPEEKT